MIHVNISIDLEGRSILCTMRCYARVIWDMGWMDGMDDRWCAFGLRTEMLTCFFVWLKGEERQLDSFWRQKISYKCMLESALVLAPRNRWANSTPISTHIHRCNLSFISSSMIDMFSLASLCLWLTWTSLLFIPADALSASSFVGCRNGGWGKKCRSSTRPACQLLMNLLPGQVSQKVIVTGAAGRTGSLVFSLLDADPRFDVVGLVRSESSAKKLIAKTNCALEEIVICDVTQMSFGHNTPTTTMSGSSSGNTWPTALENAEAMVICTSAVPQISKLSLFKAILKIPLNILNPEKKKAINFRDLQFKYKENQYPEVVDYVGQKKQIDFAKKLGVKHVVCTVLLQPIALVVWLICL